MELRPISVGGELAKRVSKSLERGGWVDWFILGHDEITEPLRSIDW